MAALFAAQLLVLSCDGAQDPTGGETHFLVACSSESSCQRGLDCLCGICSRACTGSDDCRELPRGECAPAEAGSCDAAPAQPFCDVRCTTDADCMTLSSRHRCQVGRCRASSSGSAGEGGVSACSSDEIEANQVLVIGDRFFGASHQITAYLEELARAAGALSAGERYRDNSRNLANALALGGNGIADQYATAAAELDVKVVIMNGGGGDVLVGSCESPTPDCPMLLDASAAAEELLARMAADGVEHVVYAFYPDPVDSELRAKMDALRPLIEADCAMSSVPCHWLDLRPTFAGRYADYVQSDGITPTSAGSQASAAAIWATLQQRCIAQ